VSNKDTKVACTECPYQNLVNSLKQHIHNCAHKNENKPATGVEQYKTIYIVKKNKDNCMRNEPENKYYTAQQSYQNKTQHIKEKYTK